MKSRMSSAIVLFVMVTLCKALTVCKPAVCAIKCEYGLRQNANGCPTCECNPYPPPVVCPLRKCFPCPNGFIYENGCQTCRCKPVCEPAVCPTIRCAYGLQRDANGCEICACNPGRICPRISCLRACPNGYIYINGCQKCRCL